MQYLQGDSYVKRLSIFIKILFITSVIKKRIVYFLSICFSYSLQAENSINTVI